MNGAIYLNYSGVIYTLLLFFCFFCKERVNNQEQKLYGRLIIASLFELISGIFATFSIYNEGSSILLLNITSKLFLMSMIVWVYIFSYYCYTISYEKIKDNIKKIMFIVMLFSCLMICILPLNFVNENGYVYTDGVALYAEYGSALIYIGVCIASGIHGRKKFNKKYIPLIVFLFLGMGCLVIQMLRPDLFLMVPLEVFVTAVMYHTIENPDVKMIEQLNIAKEQADKANRAKTDFLSSMSHEIRTPLNAIVGFSECIVQAEDLEEAKENASDIVGASQTLLEIVNGILDISKIEAGKIEIHNSSYNTHELLDGIIKLAKGRLGDKELDFRINIAEDIPETLYGDHANLKKVIINLLTNAIKYTDHGYFEFKVNCVKTNDICRLMISVEDSGRGIKKEDLDKLFTKFQRLDEDRNTTIEGTGLGLAITKQLVELMGGQIVVQSTYGEGSKFSVAIDQRITNDVVKKEEIVEEAMDLSGKRILIVDDNNLNLKVATKIISKYNPIIETALSGMECIEKIDSGIKYDIILMDDMMPRMSGGETLTRLKQRENFNIPVIALTANALTGMEEKYLEQGFNGYLAKPIEKDKLHATLAKYLLDDKNEKLENTVTIEPVKEDIKPEEVKPVIEEVKPSIEEVKPVTPVIEENTQKRVLIVDDNRLNIKVASALLKKYDLIVDSVESGQECIDKINSGEKYDLIFMDDMMPNKSGVETYHELEKISNFNTPVVTLTANALVGMREQYLSEGFNDYLSKPINKDELDRVVKTFLKDNKQQQKVSIDNAYKEKLNTTQQFSSVFVTKYKDVEYLKQNGIDVDRALELLGSMDMFDDMLTEFYNNINNRINKIKTFKETNDLTNYSIEVHALKSDSKYLGFTKLAEISLNHEMAGKQNNIEFINSDFNNLIDNLNKVLGFVKIYLGK